MAPDEEEDHPALRNFNKPLEYVKHTGKSALRGAIKGALIGAGIAIGLGLIGGAVLGGGILSFITAPLGVGLVAWMGGLTGGAIFGAKIGGAIGAGTGLLGAGEAVEAEQERRIASSERKEARQARLAALEQQREMQAAMTEQNGMGLRPNVGFGHGAGERTLT